MTDGLMSALGALPLIAILRGLPPDHAEAVGAALIDAGFSCIEVPFNSPDPLRSIRILAERFGTRALVGAGTVRTPDAVAAVRASGGRLIVMPHADLRVVEAAKRHGLWVLPGIATPTEAFAALDAGADGLKLFPAEASPPAVLKSLRAVLPPDIPVFPVGSITPEKMAAYRQAGAAGFGLGSALYRPGDAAATVATNAARFKAAFELSDPT